MKALLIIFSLIIIIGLGEYIPHKIESSKRKQCVHCRKTFYKFSYDVKKFTDIDGYEDSEATEKCPNCHVKYNSKNGYIYI